MSHRWSLVCLLALLVLAGCTSPTPAVPTGGTVSPPPAAPSEGAAVTTAVATPTTEPATATPAPADSTPSPDATLVAEAERLTVEGWSPDGRFLLYRTHTAADLEINPQIPPGAFHVYDTSRTYDRCTPGADHDERRPHLWLSDSELLVVTDRDEVVVWPLCADERTSWSERFPEIPQVILAASPDRSQFLFQGESRYWLFDTSTVTATAVEGMTEEEIGPPLAPTAALPIVPGGASAWSPDGRWVALIFPQSAVIVEVATGTVTQREGELLYEGLGGPPVPLWLSDTALIVRSPRGSRLVTVGGASEGVEARFFGLDPLPPTADGAQYWLEAAVGEEGSFHLALTQRGDGGAVGLPRPILLYHSETEEVEEIQAPHEATPFEAAGFSEDGQRLFAVLGDERAGSGFQKGWWQRPLDPPGSGLTLVAQSGGMPPLWSPDGRRAATADAESVTLINTEDRSVLREWPLASMRPWMWSPDGRWIATVSGEAASTGPKGLYLLPAP